MVDELGEQTFLYVKERAIGEEYRYVLDRRYAVKYPGNMLERPALILTLVGQKDRYGRQNAALGGDYERKMDQTGESAGET